MSSKTHPLAAPLAYLRGIHLSKRPSVSPIRGLIIRLLAIALGMVTCSLVAYILIPEFNGAADTKAAFEKFFNCFYSNSFSTERKTWKFVNDTAILLGIALALTPAFRMRFWNTGAEGQTLVGVLAATGVTFFLGGKIPEPLLLIIMLVSALLSGAIWGLIPALFKAKWNTNETLFTLMMNYIAMHLVTTCLALWITSGSGIMPKQEFGKLPIIYNDKLPIAILVGVLTIVMFIYLRFSKHGYEINVVGESERTARYVGINVSKVIVRTMLISGMLCGFVGFLLATISRSVTTDSVGGQGFTAIMVAWLAKFNPLMMVFTASLIVVLDHGASDIATKFHHPSSALPSVIVGIVLFFVIGCEFFINYKINLPKHHKEELK